MTKFPLFLLVSIALVACGGGGDGGSGSDDRPNITNPDVADVRINDLTSQGFQFQPDVGTRSDKVVGIFAFSLSDITNGGFIRDLNNSHMRFLERPFGSEDEYVEEVEATQSSEIEITPIDVIYLIDNSFSVVQASADDELIDQANSLANSISQLNSSNDGPASTTRFRTFADMVSPLATSASDEPFDAIDFEEQGGGTALYEGIQTSLLDLSASAEPLLFVFTDGRENASAPGFDLDLITTTAQQFGIPVYIVGLGDVNSAALTTVASESGGRFFQASSTSELAQAFQNVLRSIPVNYTVRYRPTQRTGHIEFQFVVDYTGATDSVTDNFDVDMILGN